LRLNVLDQDGGNPARAEVKDKRWAVAPSLAFGLHGPTRVYLDYLHVKQDNRPDGGVPTIGLPGYSSPDPKRPFLAAPRPSIRRTSMARYPTSTSVTADMAPPSSSMSSAAACA
jgi:catecholate siderophore receptor